MNCVKKEICNVKNKTKTTEIAPKNKVDKKCKKKYDVRAPYKMEEDVMYFTVNGTNKSVT